MITREREEKENRVTKTREEGEFSSLSLVGPHTHTQREREREREREEDTTRRQNSSERRAPSRATLSSCIVHSLQKGEILSLLLFFFPPAKTLIRSSGRFFWETL